MRACVSSELWLARPPKTVSIDPSSNLFIVLVDNGRHLEGRLDHFIGLGLPSPHDHHFTGFLATKPLIFFHLSSGCNLSIGYVLALVRKFVDTGSNLVLQFNSESCEIGL